MALKSIFKTMKNEGYVIKPLEQFLLALNGKDEDGSDRAVDVNAPSQASTCIRARYYSRKQVLKDGNSIDPRLRRIFDNGTHVHLRLQEYLTKQGILLMDEVPLRNDEYNIQGHTDGFLKLSPIEIGILEIKSIKTENFQKLKDAEKHHKEQASVYMYCAEMRRQYLQETYKSTREFNRSLAKRRSYYASLYSHVKDGSKFSRVEKIQHQVELHEKADEILFNTRKPITKVIVVYEDKNDQNLKEYLVEWDDSIIDPILEGYSFLNNAVKTNTLPNRCTTNKNDYSCKWCPYKIECWG